jgi:SAM-dependent methyltransferase
VAGVEVRMGNEFKGQSPHSAEYFGDTRDLWWHEDQLWLIAASWRADEIRHALDVGCGVGHWGRLLLRVLPLAEFTGVDREAIWVQKAAERASASGVAERFRFQVGTVEALPFPDASFDLVTCQTLLIHVADPGAALAEMTRVAKPGAVIAVAEPTNLVGPFIDAIRLGDSPARIAALLAFQLTCQRGKAAMGEGDELLGERLPQLLADAGLRGIELRLNGRGWPMRPPYESAEERTCVEEERDFFERGLWIASREVMRRRYIAGGGKELEFDELWTHARDLQRRVLEAIDAGRYVRAGGSLFYLAWGRKPGLAE